jgi:transcriptional regulator with XRE-family HTH domain
MPSFEDVGELLRAACKKLHMSQESFASALGVKLSRVQKWESGVNEPRFSIPELRKIRALNREVFDSLISGFLLLPPGYLGSGSLASIGTPRDPHRQTRMKGERT